MLATLLVALLPAAPLQLAMLKLDTGDGVTRATADTLAGVIATELRRTPGLKLVTPDDISAILSHEAQKQLVGCSDNACFVEIGAALGVDQIVAGRVARLGESWLVTLKRIDVRTVSVLADTTRRFKHGKLDDVLDALPELAATLMKTPGAPSQPTTQPPAAHAEVSSAPAADAVASPAPAPWAELPIDDPSVREKLTVLTDDRGHFVALVPDGSFGPVFYGDASKWHEQLVRGGSREGETRFDFVLWDPRQTGNTYVELREGAYKIVCGKRSVALRKLNDSEGQRARAAAALLKPRWQRRAHLLARDTDATYYYVDTNRYGDEPTYHLYIGAKGALSHVPLTDAVVDSGGAAFFSARGKLWTAAGEVRWAPRGGESQLLVSLELEPQARLIYTSLGAYRGERLGTVCDDLP